MPLKILVIDDSAYSRAALTGLLKTIPGVEDVSTAVDGVDGYRQALKMMPDLIMLDLEMPNMDGFTFLRLIKDKQQAPVIVLTGRKWETDAATALELGAVDFLEKPALCPSDRFFSIKGELVKRIGLIPYMRPHNGLSLKRQVKAAGKTMPDIIAIGASTGGPKAISTIIRALPSDLGAAVVISLHMPPWLTEPFVERLNSESLIQVRIAEDGCMVERGGILIAPGGSHMTFFKSGSNFMVRLEQRGSEDHYAPSVDRMFSSAAKAWGPRLTGIVLTGMGTDGRQGAEEIKSSGGYVIAESKESSILFSMPEAIISAGISDEVLSVGEIGEWIVEKCSLKH